MELLTDADQADTIRGVMNTIERHDRMTLLAREGRGFRLLLDLLLRRARMGRPDR
jgi:hypothetical protein